MKTINVPRDSSAQLAGSAALSRYTGIVSFSTSGTSWNVEAYFTELEGYFVLKDRKKSWNEFSSSIAATVSGSVIEE